MIDFRRLPIPLAWRTPLIKRARRMQRKWRPAIRLKLGRLGPLPGFVIIGAAKSGTTTLYDTLSRHPQVIPALLKETNYFSKAKSRGEDWYRTYFYHSGYDCKGQRIAGEASPKYLLDPQVPERVARLLPDVRLIAILRDPADRAISHYHHTAWLGYDVMPIDEAVDSAIDSIDPFKNCPWPETYAHLTENRAVQANGKAHLIGNLTAFGLYANQLAHWFQYFDQERLLLIKSEDFFADPGRTFANICRYLDIDEMPVDIVKKRNVGSYPTPDEEVRFKLRAFYEEPNRRLDSLTGTRFGWNQDPSKLAGSATSPASEPLSASSNS